GYESSEDQRPVCPRNLPGSTSSSTEGPTFFTTTSGRGGAPTYRALASALSPGPGTLIVAVPLTEVSATLDRLLGVELVVSGIALLLVAGFALWLVRLGLRPLEGIGATAGAIAAGDLSRRVEPATDRTEVGRLGLALNAMLAQIEAAFEERRASENRLRRFVADASHELRTPLTSIRGYAELFRRGADSRPEDLAKSMQRIEAEAARMGVLVDDLLLLARLDQGRPLEREPLDLARIVEEAVDSARAVEPARPIDLGLHGPTSVVGDAGRLRQAVDNLLDNARVHTPASSRVRVTLRPDDGVVLLTVADEGPGLPAEVATRAFERFYRGDPSRSRSMGGAGLGLSIVAAIVESHGGTVNVRSEEGAGATFEVRLPASGNSLPAGEEEIPVS
ncbi:MAG TPA: HAMP domain-containing sensor histidine kinase, partial [Actinomycetota bacterium]|nr:HAMP domain-containing sensor histidine kinase [Actinomycetota bacterium]